MPGEQTRPRGGTTLPDTRAEIVERLQGHRAFAGAPVAELEWLTDHGQLRRVATGEVLRAKDEPIDEMWVILSGHLAFYPARGSGRGKMMEWFGGDVAGALPYSRTTTSFGEGVVEEELEALCVPREHLEAMIRAAPTLTTTCVHIMLARARHFTMESLQDEKMIALGRLSAGLAHELNNPASAAARSARLLGGAVTDACDAAEKLGTAALTAEQRALVQRLQHESVGSTTGMWSALDFSDREDAFESWLQAHGLETDLTAALAETALTTSDLDELADKLSPEQLRPAVRRIASEQAARALTVELERSASRMHELVSSVKRFTYMGRGAGAEPVDVKQSISDTVAVVASKARGRRATVETDLQSEMPPVNAYGGELNQVWHNLIDNALDAIDEGGVVRVEACSRRDSVVVSVIDNGRGIEPEIQGQVFDPFFTTKDVQEGTGLGLDIARRIVVRHNGTIELESRPGRTVFRVLLPIAAGSDGRRTA